MTDARVLLGDWRDVLPGTYDPDRAVVVTDPPFGLNGPGGGMAPGSHARGYAREYVKGIGEDVMPWAEHVRQVLELLPARRHVIRGPATAIVARDHPMPRRLCMEIAAHRRREAAKRPGVVPYLWHAWAVYGRLLIGRRRLPPQGDALLIRPYVNEISPPRRSGTHRALTPYASAYWAVETWAEPDWLVLDPFAGLGTIGQVAGALGIDYLGAELDPVYAAEAQLNVETAQPRLAL